MKNPGGAKVISRVPRVLFVAGRPAALQLLPRGRPPAPAGQREDVRPPALQGGARLPRL